MINAFTAAASQWLRYRKTFHALKTLGPWLRADLGLTDKDIAAIAAKAARGDTVSIYQLVKAADTPEHADTEGDSWPPAHRNPSAVRTRFETPAAGRAGSLRHCQA